MQRTTPRVPGALLEDLRGLARKYGSVALVEGCAAFVASLAVKGVTAELAARQDRTSEQCPRCRERQAVLDEAKAALRPRQAAQSGGEP